MHTAISRARARSDRRIESMKRRATPDQVFRGQSELQFGPTNSAASLGGESALNHNRGEPYAASRPIAQRIAGQPIQVAEVVSAAVGKGGRKDWRRPKSGARRLSVEEMARLPVWVRSRIGLPVDDDQGRCVKAIKAMHSDAVRVDILEAHPVLELLNAPNPRLNLHTLMDMTVTSLQFTGRCFWWLSNSKVRPYDLWLIPEKRVREKANNVMLKAGYEILSDNTDGGTGESVSIPADMMIYFYIPDPDDPMKPLPPAQACVQAVRVDEAISTCQQQTFENGCFPALAFILGDLFDAAGKNMGKPLLERSQLNQLQTRLEQLYKGPAKHGKSIILDRLINEVKPVSNKPNEMDWQNSAAFNRDKIWRNFGTPKVIAGDVENANRATALVADEAFTNNVCNPRAMMISHVMQDKLLPKFTEPGENLLIWIEECTSTDRDAKTKELELLLNNRGLLVDELRAEMSLPPLPNQMGQVLVSTSMQIFEPIDGSIDDRSEYLNLEDDGTAIDVDTERIEQDGKAYRSTAHKDFATAWLKLHGRNEQVFASDLQRFLAAQARGILGKLKAQLLGGDVNSVSVDSLFDPRDWDEPLLKLAMPNLMRAEVAGAVHLLRSVKSFTKDAIDDWLLKIPPSVVERMRVSLDDALSRDYWPGINDTTQKAVADAVSAAIAAGESPQQTVTRVRTALGATSLRNRAATIARTETTGALNAGSLAAIQELQAEGAVEGWDWLATADEHTRATHHAVDGQKSDEKGLCYPGGQAARYPGDPNLTADERVHCRCTAVPRLVSR